MVTASNVLLAVALASALCAVVAAVMVAGWLDKRGVKINWIWLRVLLLSRYLGQYRDVTRQETGRTGPLFYVYVVGMIVALVAAVAVLLLRVL